MPIHLFSILNCLSFIIGIGLVILPVGLHIFDIPNLFRDNTVYLYILFMACGFIALYHRRRYWLLVILCFLGMVRGLDVANAVALHVLSADYDDYEFTVDGTIIGLPKAIESYGRQGQQFDFDVDKVHCLAQQGMCVGQHLQRLRLRWYGQDAIRAGQQWQLQVSLRRPRGLSNPSGMDYEVWLIQQGFSATGKVLEGSLLGEPKWYLQYRERITTHIQQNTECLRHPGILEALINGNNSAISPALWTMFSQTNTTHLFVISGLHLTLVGGLMWWFTRRVFVLIQPYPPHRAMLYAAILAWLLAGAYALLAGWSFPVQRAWLFFTLVLFVLMWRRSLNAGQSIGVLFATSVGIQPLSLLSMSFWLSWCAGVVLALCFVGRKFQPKWYMWFKSQWVIFLGLLPILLVAIGQVSILGLFANLIAIPVINLFVVPVNLFALLLSYLTPELAKVLWVLLDHSLHLLLLFLSWLSDKGRSFLWYPAFNMANILLFAFAILIYLLPRGLGVRPLAIVCSLPLLMGQQQDLLARDALKLTVFDVGQGLAVLMQVNQRAVLYDTGPPLGMNLDAGASVILPFLRQQGIKRLDYLIVSHPDNDHSGGLNSLVQGISVDQIYGSHGLSLKRTRPCNDAVKFSIEPFHFEFIYPQIEHGLSRETNSQSCVLRVSYGDDLDRPALMLLTGDMTKKDEMALIRQQRESLSSELLFMPHHGSKSSSTSAFIKAVEPKWAIASAGYRHYYGHPHPDIVKRYESHDVVVLNTAETGAISMMWQPTGWKLEKFERHVRSYFWQ